MRYCGRQLLNGISQPSRFLTPNGECFRVDAAIGPQLLKFLPIRHEFFQREVWIGSKLAPAPTHQAAVLCDLIEPHHERFGTVEFGQVRNRFQQHFLHRIFRVLALTADAHAEGEHSILEQSQSLLQRRIVTPLQELHGLFYLRTHCSKCSMANISLVCSERHCASVKRKSGRREKSCDFSFGHESE